jgi:hypothetical protein
VVRDIERYRPQWGRKDVFEPRQCAFIGTTNKALYLRDESCNRRFWPVKTGVIDLARLRQDRDELLAEAVHRYRTGAVWWPDAKFERETIADEQEARYEPDAWEQPIAAFLDSLPKDLVTPKRTTILDIAIGALDYEEERPERREGDPPPVRGTPINRLNINDQQRIARVLTHLGWVPKRTKRERWWEPSSARNDAG